jgi:hypothetical protein
MMFGAQVVINMPPNVRKMAEVIYAAGTKPEIELFDSGDILLMHDLVRDGTIKGTSSRELGTRCQVRLPSSTRNGIVCPRDAADNKEEKSLISGGP